MTVAVENLIDLNLLSHYDTKLKEWAKEQIKNGGSVEVTQRSELPAVGEEGKIYFVEDAILQYTAANGYQKIGGTGSPQKIEWHDF
jgi:hypothetical protein